MLSGPGSPENPPAPKYPIGPYTGAVATTDVSILYPLLTNAHATDLVRASASGSHGALLPQSVVDTVHPGVTNVHAFGYLHRTVSIMQRAANESVLVADRVADPHRTEVSPTLVGASNPG